MYDLRDKETGEIIGTITEEQFKFLMDQLEEESANDSDYYINEDMLELFEEQGADPQLIRILRDGLGDREEMEIEWTRR